MQRSIGTCSLCLVDYTQEELESGKIFQHPGHGFHIDPCLKTSIKYSRECPSKCGQSIVLDHDPWYPRIFYKVSNFFKIRPAIQILATGMPFLGRLNSDSQWTVIGGLIAIPATILVAIARGNSPKTAVSLLTGTIAAVAGACLAVGKSQLEIQIPKIAKIIGAETIEVALLAGMGFTATLMPIIISMIRNNTSVLHFIPSSMLPLLRSIELKGIIGKIVMATTGTFEQLGILLFAPVLATLAAKTLDPQSRNFRSSLAATSAVIGTSTLIHGGGWPLAAISSAISALGACWFSKRAR